MENYSADMAPIDELKWLSERANYLFSSIESDYKNAQKLNVDIKNTTKSSAKMNRKTQAMNRETQIKKKRMVKEIERQNRVCSYCGSEKYYARGLCRTCYQRYLRNGTVEHKQKKVIVPHSYPQKPHWTYKLMSDVVEQISEFPVDLEESIYTVLDTLTPQQKQVILMRYGDEQTLASCKNVFGVTREWIRQIQIKAISELKKPERVRYFTLGLNGIRKKECGEIEKEM